jgi:hypothetical protein
MGHCRIRATLRDGRLQRQELAVIAHRQRLTAGQLEVNYLGLEFDTETAPAVHEPKLES